MGASNSKEVQRQLKKRDDTSDSIPMCPSGASWYDENCADPDQESHGCFFADPCGGHAISSSSTHAATSTSDGCNPPESFYDTSCNLPGSFYYGCFYPNPCISAISDAAAESSKDVSPKNAKRASQPTCPSGYSLYKTSCGDTGYFEGCFNEAPCDHLGSVTATPTLTITKTNSAQTKTAILTTSASSNTPPSSTNLPSSSQTVTTTSSTPAQTATPVAAVSSAPASTSSMLAQPATPLAAISSAPAKPSLSPSPSRLDKTAVAAGTVGGIIGAIVALVLMLLVLRWRKRHKRENLQTIKHESEVQVQSPDANGTGSSFNGSEFTPAYRDADHHMPLYSGTRNPDNAGETAYKLHSSPSALQSQPPTQPGPTISGPTPDATGRQPELAFHNPAEVPLKTEDSLIDIPGQFSGPSKENSSSQSSLQQTADGPVMHPNLDLTDGEIGDGSAKKKGGSHIMSWMNYDGDGYGSGPER